MSQYSLINKKRFLPLFITQFFGGFNDNLLRNALVVLIAFKFTGENELLLPPEILITLASALLVLPYIFFSSLAGQIADKFERSQLIRITKYAELVIVLLASYGFFIGNIYFLLFTIFLIGTQATFFSPMKYSVLPDHLAEKELITGNGMLEGGTFIAILLGSVIGSQLGNVIELSEFATILPVCVTMLAAALIGIFAAHQVPVAAAARPELVIQRNLFASSWAIIADIIKNKVLFYAVLGTSWFWLIGSVFLSQMPSFAKDVLQADADVFTALLIVFSLGIAAGCVACAEFLKGEISAKLAPISLVGVSLFTFLLVAETTVFSSHYRSELFTLGEFFANQYGWLVMLSVFGIAFCAGLYVVPLKAIIQTKAEPKSRSRVIAADNFINAVGMVAASIVVALLLSIGMGINGVFVMLAVVNLAVAVFILLLLPYKTLMVVVGWVVG